MLFPNDVVVLGNGPSRLFIDPEDIPFFTIGCNAIYRDFSPDLLVVADGPMQQEIIDSGYNKPVIARRNAKYPLEYPPNFKVLEGKVKSSGLWAISMALAAGSQRVYTLGFDFDFGTNVYAATSNYPSRNSGSVRCWLRDYTKLTRSRKVFWVNDFYCKDLKKSRITREQFLKTCSNRKARDQV